MPRREKITDLQQEKPRGTYLYSSRPGHTRKASDDAELNENVYESFPPVTNLIVEVIL